MRIAMVSEHASPLAVLGGEDAGGQNVHVAALASALAARGHRIEVYTRRDDPRTAPVVPLCADVDVVHVPAGPPCPVPKDELLPLMPRFGAWLAARWRHQPPDLVHTHFWMSALAALQARSALPVPVPVVATFHALGTVKRRYQGEQDTSPAQRIGVETRVARSADAVIATCSDEVRELRALGTDLAGVHVIPCGVDLDAFRPGPKGRGGSSGPVGSPGSVGSVGSVGPGPVPPRRARYRLLCLGRLVERKGIDTVIAALAQVPDTELLVAGGPDAHAIDTDPDCRRLAAAARAYGVTDRVRLLGRVTRAEAPALIRSADLVVSVPWYEPFGIVPLEAMACGVPVVTSAVGGMLDTVLSEVTGVHVPPRDAGALAGTLRSLLADQATRARLGRRAAAHVAACFGWDRVAELTEQAYQQVLAESRARQAVASIAGRVAG